MSAAMNESREMQPHTKGGVRDDSKHATREEANRQQIERNNVLSVGDKAEAQLEENNEIAPLAVDIIVSLITACFQRTNIFCTVNEPLALLFSWAAAWPKSTATGAPCRDGDVSRPLCLCT